MYTYTCLKESTHAIYVCSKVLQYQSNLLINRIPLDKKGLQPGCKTHEELNFVGGYENWAPHQPCFHSISGEQKSVLKGLTWFKPDCCVSLHILGCPHLPSNCGK